MNSLGRLHDANSLELLTKLTRNANAKVRAAAAHALAWTGDPAYLKTVRSVVAAADPATRSEALDANLRLLNSMERQRPHRHEALAGYRALVESTRGPVQDGALAGLGRAGDASCVPVSWPPFATPPRRRSWSAWTPFVPCLEKASPEP